MNRDSGEPSGRQRRTAQVPAPPKKEPPKTSHAILGGVVLLICCAGIGFAALDDKEAGSPALRAPSATAEAGPTPSADQRPTTSVPAVLTNAPQPKSILPSGSSARLPKRNATTQPDRGLEPCELVPRGIFAGAGLAVGPYKPTIIRRIDSRTFIDRDLDALYTCDAGFDVELTIFDRTSSSSARAAVIDYAATAADTATASSTRLPKRIAELGYIIDDPDIQTASAKWQHDDLHMDIMISYADQPLTHGQVLTILRDAVIATDQRLGTR